MWLKAVRIVGHLAFIFFAAATVGRLLDWSLGRRAQSMRDRFLRRWYVTACRILNVHVETVGTASSNAALLASNHISWLDIPVLGSQQPIDFIAKQEVRDWPVIGYIVEAVGTLFLRRGDAAHAQVAAEQIAWRLRQGRRVLLFPEGTTTAGDRVLRFHSKLFQPGHLTGTPVQAIALEYRNEAATTVPFVGDDEFVPHLWRVLALKRIDVRIYYCEPLDAGLTVAEMARASRAQVVAALSLPTTKAEAG